MAAAVFFDGDYGTQRHRDAEKNGENKKRVEWQTGSWWEATRGFENTFENTDEGERFGDTTASRRGRNFCVAGRPGLADFSPCVSAAQWFEPASSAADGSWMAPHAWPDSMSDSLISRGAAMRAIRPPGVLWDRSQGLPADPVHIGSQPYER